MTGDYTQDGIDGEGYSKVEKGYVLGMKRLSRCLSGWHNRRMKVHSKKATHNAGGVRRALGQRLNNDLLNNARDHLNQYCQ